MVYDAGQPMFGNGMSVLFRPQGIGAQQPGSEKSTACSAMASAEKSGALPDGCCAAFAEKSLVAM